MARILALDYGKVRTGIAVTDELQLVASALDTVSTPNLIPYLKKYFKEEKVAKIVVGEPKQMNGNPSEVETLIRPFLERLKMEFPNTAIERQDERFTSKMAMDAMIAGGMKKKKRQDKAEIDKISATLILQSYLESN